MPIFGAYKMHPSWCLAGTRPSWTPSTLIGTPMYYLIIVKYKVYLALLRSKLVFVLSFVGVGPSRDTLYPRESMALWWTSLSFGTRHLDWEPYVVSG